MKFHLYIKIQSSISIALNKNFIFKIQIRKISFLFVSQELQINNKKIVFTYFQHQMSFQQIEFDKNQEFLSSQQKVQPLNSNAAFQKSDLKNTMESQEVLKQTQIRTRSIKKLDKIQEMSFQKDFLKQHLQPCVLQFKKYFGHLFDCYHHEDQLLMMDSILNKNDVDDHRTYQINHLLSSNDCLLQPKKRQIFMEDLRYQQYLNDFLSQIVQKLCKQAGNQFLFITNMIWEEYIEIQHLKYSYKTLIQAANKITEKVCSLIKDNPQIKYFGKKSSQKKISQSQLEEDRNLFKIINFLATTTFLISAEYYDNPFYQSNKQCQLKRLGSFLEFDNEDSLLIGFSDDEQSGQIEFFVKGKKRVKEQ